MRKFRVVPPATKRVRSLTLGSNHREDSFFLGNLSEVGPAKTVHLDATAEHVVAIVGKRGSGKTHTLGVLVEGLCCIDPTGVVKTSHNQNAVLLFDTLNLFQWIGIPLESAEGSFVERQRQEASSWGLPAITIEPRFWHLAGSTPVTPDSSPFSVRVSDMSPQDWGLLMDVDIVTDPMGQLIAATHDKVTRIGWNGNGRRIPPKENHSIADLVACIADDQQLGDDFATDTRRAIRQRLGAYERTDLFSENGTSLSEVLNPGQVSIMLLSRCPEDLRRLVVFLLIRRLLDQRALDSEMAKDALIRGVNAPPPEIPKTWVVIDEAQNIIPNKTASMANQELTRFVREGRNFGLSMAISTQQPDAIDARIMAQVDVLIAHTLTTSQDSGYVVRNLKASLPTSIKLGLQSLNIPESLRELEIGQCLVSAVDAERTYFVEIRPRVTPHGGFGV